MTKTLARTYCLCLYCDYDSKVKSLDAAFGDNDKFSADFYDERDHIEEIMYSLGNDAEWLGSAGSTTTWDVKEVAMPRLLRKIQDYNSKKEYFHIIQFELF